jgi:alanyl-tRNA synthetase
MEQELAHSLSGQLRHRFGHTLMQPRSVVAQAEDGTFFVTAGIQLWRDWALSAHAPAAGRVGLQWCVRTNRPESAGMSGILTSFTMLTHVSRGPMEREAFFEGLLESFGAVGLDPGRLAFLTREDEAGRGGDDFSVKALTRLGVPRSRLGLVARRYAAPFPDGPFGPNVFVLAENGPECGIQCAPTCTCGRWFHFWNCEFLDYLHTHDRTAAPAETPLVDSAGSSERLAAAVRGESDTYLLPAMRSLHAEVTAVCQVPADLAPASAKRLLRRITDRQNRGVAARRGRRPGSQAPWARTAAADETGVRGPSAARCVTMPAGRPGRRGRRGAPPLERLPAARRDGAGPGAR